MSVMEGILGSTISICVTIVFCVLILTIGQYQRESKISRDEVHKAAIEKSGSGTIVFTD